MHRQLHCYVYLLFLSCICLAYPSQDPDRLIEPRWWQLEDVAYSRDLKSVKFTVATPHGEQRPVRCELKSTKTGLEPQNIARDKAVKNAEGFLMEGSAIKPPPGKKGMYLDLMYWIRFDRTIEITRDGRKVPANAIVYRSKLPVNIKNNPAQKATAYAGIWKPGKDPVPYLGSKAMERDEIAMDPGLSPDLIKPAKRDTFWVRDDERERLEGAETEKQG